jgi:amino acid transporter
MVGLGASVVLFLLIQVVCIGTFPNLAGSERPVAEASQNFLGAFGPVIISIGALVGIFGTLNVIMLACTRLPFAMAAQGQLPAPLAQVHRRFRTPHVSIGLCAAIVFLLSLQGTFIYALKVTVITRVLVYASTCVALPVLRRRAKTRASIQTQGEAPASFAAPGGILVSVISVILCLWLLANSGWREARDVAIAIAIGLVIYAATRIAQRRLKA